MAEKIGVTAQSGLDAAVTEQALEAYLRQTSAQGRVERFGELTYGVFFREDVNTIATWAGRLQSGLARAETS